MKKAIYFLLMFLPLLITFCALPFLPEQVPAHYNFEGEVDRFGSKYETLIFPVCTILMGVFMLWMAKIGEKESEKNGKTVFYTGMGISVWFTVMHCYTLFMDFKNAANLYDFEFDINQIFCVLLGAGMVIMGCFMPKLKNNSLIGLRTSWSMKNDITWEKSQRFGGISFVVIGVLTALAGVLLESYAAMFVALGLIIIDAIICVIYSYKIAKKY